MGIREQLHPISQGSRTYLPPACHTMSTNEKRSFCHCLRMLKVPQGYSSNIKSLVSVNYLKLVELKSHDCHDSLTLYVLDVAHCFHSLRFIEKYVIVFVFVCFSLMSLDLFLALLFDFA